MSRKRLALHRTAIPCLLALALSACASSGGSTGGKGTVSTKRPPVRAPITTPLRDPQFRMEPGLEQVVGATQGQLVGQFGQPRLDVWEGDARKLQFTGTACILDIYLYPTSRSRDPLATYVEARRSDGRDVDKAACVNALRASGGR
ncbi:MAG: hypothetical protein KDE25_10935 [Novosphingobium sp.]|nr:hypothetical protein [Novosphingobium sp.]